HIRLGLRQRLSASQLCDDEGQPDRDDSRRVRWKSYNLYGQRRAGGDHVHRGRLTNLERTRRGGHGPPAHPRRAHTRHPNRTSVLLEAPVLADLAAKDLAVARQHEGGADIGMAGKGYFGGGREDTNARRVPLVDRW